MLVDVLGCPKFASVSPADVPETFTRLRTLKTSRIAFSLTRVPVLIALVTRISSLLMSGVWTVKRGIRQPTLSMANAAVQVLNANAPSAAALTELPSGTTRYDPELLV